MTKALKALLPISFRNHFRPDYQYWRMKYTNLKETVFGTNHKWKEARVQLQSLTTDEEFYEFSQKEFGIGVIIR
jgi:hypothetical protein